MPARTSTVNMRCDGIVGRQAAWRRVASDCNAGALYVCAGTMRGCVQTAGKDHEGEKIMEERPAGSAGPGSEVRDPAESRLDSNPD